MLTVNWIDKTNRSSIPIVALYSAPLEDEPDCAVTTRLQFMNLGVVPVLRAYAKFDVLRAAERPEGRPSVHVKGFHEE
jgi:hypothetical protein